MELDEVYKHVLPQFCKMANNTKLKDPAIEADDLIQEGCLLLLECFNRYKVEDKQLRGLVVRSFANLLKDYYRKKYLEAEDIDEPGNEPCDDEWVQSFMVKVFINELSLLLSALDKSVLNELVGMNTKAMALAHHRSVGLPSCTVQTMDVAKALKIPYWQAMRSVKRIRESYKTMRGVL